MLWIQILFVVICVPNIIIGVTAASNPSIFEKFLNIGCEFSGVVSRVRRSAPPTPEPNFDDPEELFQYLYPLADVKNEDDGNVESQRSHGTLSLSSWIEDLLELWHSECHHRRNKRSAKRMSTSNGKGQRKSPTTSTRRYPESRHRNSSLGITPRADASHEPEILEDEPYYYEESNEGEMNEDDGGESDEEKLRRNKPKPDKPDKPNKKPDDIFFTQYGGDIEYFFPLLSFGIPFDGEITLLGFHGFRGIFPY